MSRLKHKRVMKLAKGYRGRGKNVYSVAVNRVEKALWHAYKGRKLKKRDYRRLWIQQINAASRLHDVRYNRLIHGLNVAGIDLNRRVLAELAITEPYSFKAVVETVRVEAERRAATEGADSSMGAMLTETPGVRSRRRAAASKAVAKSGVTLQEAWISAKEGSATADDVGGGGGLGARVATLSAAFVPPTLMRALLTLPAIESQTASATLSRSDGDESRRREAAPVEDLLAPASRSDDFL